MPIKKAKNTHKPVKDKVINIAIDQYGIVRALLYASGRVFIYTVVQSSPSTYNALQTTYQWQELFLPL